MRARKKISIGPHYPTCVLVSFLRIISIRQSKRGGRTTSQSDFTNPNVRRWSFFGFHTTSKQYQAERAQKKRVLVNDSSVFEGLEIFSIGRHYPICVLASFFRIISIRQSKRGGRTTSQSDFTNPNVRRWSFFGFHTHFKAISS